MEPEEPKKNGRPTTCTPQVQKAIVKYVKMGLPPERAAVAQGIGRATFQRWRQEASVGKGPWPTIEADVGKARNTAQERWLKKIEKASSGSWQAAAWLLERTDRETFSLQNTVQISIQVAKEREALLDLAEEVLDRGAYERLLEACARRGGVEVPKPRDVGGSSAEEPKESVH